MDRRAEIFLTVDVEWACPEVLADLRGLLDTRGLRATFFCTHAGIAVPGHERALHPNFRRTGDTVRALGATAAGPAAVTDEAVYRHVVRTTQSFCPEAVGVRAHSLLWDLTLLGLYRDAGLRYDASYLMPLAPGLQPFSPAFGMVEIPIYYMDYWDLGAAATGFRLSALALDRPGLKVFDFHPNLVFLNARTMEQYLASKPHYHDVDRLRRLRRPGRGVRTLFLELLDHIAASGLPTVGLAALADRVPVAARGPRPPASRRAAASRPAVRRPRRAVASSRVLIDPATGSLDSAPAVRADQCPIR